MYHLYAKAERGTASAEVDSAFPQGYYMIMIQYDIAGLTVFTTNGLGPDYGNFIKENADGPAADRIFRIDFCRPAEFSVPESREFTINQEQFSVSKTDGGFLFKANVPDCGDSRSVAQQPAILYVDKKYTSASAVPGCGLEHLLRLAIESRLILENKITFHSSCINTPLGAVCFTGPSGTGKSTRAAALCRAMKDTGFSLISGDRPLLDCRTPAAFGMPWDGKEGVHLSVKAPLHSILAVRRLDECADADRHESLDRLDEKDSYKNTVSQTFLPMWDTDLAVRAMSNLKKLLAQTCVYRAVSGPDAESVMRLWELIN